jgi:hypothetical protein
VLARASNQARTPLGAAEDDAVDLVEVADGVGDGVEVGGRGEGEAGEGDGVGAVGREHVDEVAGLLAGAGDDDAAAEQGALFEPLDRAAEVDDAADDHDGGRADALGVDAVGELAERGDDGALDPAGAPADQRGGGAGVASGGDQALGVLAAVFDAHHEDEGAGAAGEVLPVEAAAAFFVGLVAGGDGDAGAVVAVGDGDAGGLGGGDRGADAGDKLVGEAGRAQDLGLLGAAAKDHGVAALEADDVQAGAGLGEQEAVDLVLVGDGLAVGVAAVRAVGALVELDVGPAVGEEGGVDEVVGDDDVGAGEAVAPSEGQQLGVPGTPLPTMDTKPGTRAVYRRGAGAREAGSRAARVRWYGPRRHARGSTGRGGGGGGARRDRGRVCGGAGRGRVLVVTGSRARSGRRRATRASAGWRGGTW